MGQGIQQNSTGGKGQPTTIQPSAQPMSMNGNVTYPGQGGQPQMGQANPYANTVVSSDNQPSSNQIGKGKG